MNNENPAPDQLMKASEPADPARKDPRTGAGACVRGNLGVLFVHGIGEQKEGETLIAFGEPIIAWVREWVSGHGMLAFSEPLQEDKRQWLSKNGYARPDGVEVSCASLLPSRRQSADPAHSLIDIRIKHEGPGLTQQHRRWLFAESWWGEQVQPPPVFDLLGWLFSRGPWVAFAHAAEHAWQFTHPRYTGSRTWKENLLRKLDITRWRNLAWAYAIGRFLFATVVLQLFLLAAWVFALIPIPAVRRYVSIVLQRATLILGDSYGLVANETQRGAILTRFQGTLNWLDARCDKLVIVAHSQGTAVVHAAIQESLIPRPTLLVTFGAGLTKLSQLRLCEVARGGRLTASGWIVPTVILASLLSIWLGWGTGSQVWGLSLLILTLYVASLACGIGAWTAWNETRTYPQVPPAPSDGGTFRWVDLYASSDPVPQGDLTEHLPDPAILSERIINRRSLLSDHTAYWKNKPEFVSRVVAELDKEAQLLGIPDLRSDEDYQRAKRHHHRTIFALSLAWWGIVVSVLVVAVTQFSYLADIGERLLPELNKSGPLSSLASTLTAPGQVIDWLTRELTGTAPAIYPKLGYASLVVIGLLLLAYLWWHVVAALMIKWDSAQLADFLDYKNSKLWGKYGTWIVWPFMGLFVLVSPAIVYAICVGGNPLLIVQVAAILIGVLFALSVLLSVIAAIPKNFAGALAILRQILAVLVDAVTPGSDDLSSERRGWNAWERMFLCVIAATVIAIALAMGLERLTSQRDFGSEITLVPYVLAVVLVLIRLFRLVVQRGYARWVGAVATGAPLVLAGCLATLVDPVAFQFSHQLVVAGSFAVLLIPLAYAAVDRLLPPRGASSHEQTNLHA